MARLRFLPLVLAATVGLFALTTVLTAQPPTPASPDGTKRTEDDNYKLYKRFADDPGRNVVLRLSTDL